MKYWIAVACAAHVRLGRGQGFMQVNHGKLAPLKRIKPRDGVVYYSPTEHMGGSDKLQSFVAIGQVQEREPYLHNMGGGFVPHRRDVTWFTAQETSIRPLLSELSFSAGNANWGYQLRFGLFEITEQDWGLITRAMQADAISVTAASSQIAQVSLF
jgi:EVE domain